MLAGFSFGAYIAAHAAAAPRRRGAGRSAWCWSVPPPPANRCRACLPDSVVIHGETDDVVPLAATLAWARPQSLPVIVFPGVGHFFHGQLGLLKNTVVQELQPRVPL